jgi:hypothetical protein
MDRLEAKYTPISLPEYHKYFYKLSDETVTTNIMIIRCRYFLIWLAGLLVYVVLFLYTSDHLTGTRTDTSMPTFLTFARLEAGKSWPLYNNSILGIAFQYPYEWKKNEFAYNLGGNHSIVEFTAPAESSKSILLSSSPASFNIYVFSSLRTPLKALINETYLPVQGIHINLTKTIRLSDGTAAYILGYNISTGHNVFEKEQIWFAKNGAGYVITYTAVPSKYLQYLPVVRNMINSIRFSTGIKS